jgi:hypothetical protein
MQIENKFRKHELPRNQKSQKATTEKKWKRREGYIVYLQNAILQA